MGRETYCVLSITLSQHTKHQWGRKQQPELHLECFILDQTEGRTFSKIQYLVLMVLLAGQLQYNIFNSLQISATSAKLFVCPLCQRSIPLRCGHKSHKRAVVTRPISTVPFWVQWHCKEARQPRPENQPGLANRQSYRMWTLQTLITSST